MNLEKRFIAVSQHLNQHLKLVNSEVLHLAANIPLPYKEWISEINKLSDQEKMELENNFGSVKIQNSEYISYLNEIKALITLPKKQYSPQEIDPNLGKKISQKKKHEISLIAEQIRNSGMTKIIDIGSGAGHLSSVLLSLPLGIKESLCIDAESKFQQIGIDKLKRYAPNILEKIKFETILVGDETHFSLNERELLIGLHCCGDLSTQLIKIFAKAESGAFLNYGCCYHKLTPTNLNLSAIAQTQGVELSAFALNMAAKGHKLLTLATYFRKKAVKTFRYPLYFFNSRLLGLEFTPLGNATKEDYAGNFGDYVEKYSPQTIQKTSREKVTQFFDTNEVQKEIEDLLSLGIIRSQLARLIELYIILDRALFLEESGMKVELLETFDRQLSPRNLSLFAQLV